MEIPEDLSVHRGAEEPKKEQEEIKEKERISRTEPLEKRLAYFLIQEMLPSEIIEGEGFKVSFPCRKRKFYIYSFSQVGRFLKHP